MARVFECRSLSATYPADVLNRKTGKSSEPRPCLQNRLE
jgi:hypothetical protein